MFQQAVYNGSKKLGQTPFRGKSIAAGRHRLRVKKASLGINEAITVDIPQNRGIKVKLIFIKQNGKHVLVSQKKTQL